MTPDLRSLFEGTVEPLLDRLRLRDELRKKERNRARCESALARNTRELEKEQTVLAELEEGSPAYVKQQRAVLRVEQRVS
jgi:hypothetical protein